MKKIVSAILAALAVVIVGSTSVPAKASPQAPNASYWTSVCCTSAGSCQTPQVVQNGYPCWCNFGYVVYGNAC